MDINSSCEFLGGKHDAARCTHYLLQRVSNTEKEMARTCITRTLRLVAAEKTSSDGAEGGGETGGGGGGGGTKVSSVVTVEVAGCSVACSVGGGLVVGSGMIGAGIIESETDVA